MATTECRRLPSFVSGLALLWAVSVCASASVIFTIMVDSMDVPPALCVSWRLAWVEILQFVPFCFALVGVRRSDKVLGLVKEWHDEGTALTEEGRSRDTIDEANEALLPRIVGAIPWMILSGFCFGVHFSSWVYSLQETSLTHSLLFVSMGPILLNSSAWILFILGLNSVRPSWAETTGALLGFLGAVISLGDVGRERDVGHTPTLHGNLAALLGAFAFCGYLVIGRQLRAWMPLWIYAFGVVGGAYVTSLLIAFAMSEGLSLSDVFGYVHRPYVLMALYLGAGPGVGGHTLLNALVKYITPLTISTAMLSVPLIGSFMGYMVGLEGLPGLYTWAGGVVLLTGLFLVVLSESVTTAS
eukprot:CAMPEP_0194028246 /NCGR_PEP_ID=MMETSP0009_2-20130614/2267_1 /TAXON_ID=210454 /ORGANISM="Grammatophora oceanica, Strain CCMP 410" /LENGTH=356 /DNA_ID=CAMNT_0038667579 /DNA_START=70 /DNA_END=1140 /DNA_ORIENTATION=-